MFGFILLVASVLLPPLSPNARPHAAGARSVVDSALARMGGAQALRAIERVQMDVMTEWYRTVFDTGALPPLAGHELTREMRDYTIPAWRYSRQFFGPGGARAIANAVVDSVAATAIDGRWRPQSVAYVDERDEVFTFAAERVLLLAHGAPDLRRLPDTTMGGVTFHRVAATLGRFRPTLYFRAGDGLLAMARYRAGHPNDFGLVPWGEMDVDIRYSRWIRPAGSAVTLPAQLEVYRVGRPYKRMTTVAFHVNPAIPADSFTIADSLRQAFLAAGRKPMHDLPMDSARVVDGWLAQFGAAGTPVGAIKLGGRWLLVEGGVAPLSTERSVRFLQGVDSDARLEGALVTAAAGSGGVAWLLRQSVPTWAAGVAQDYVAPVLRGWQVSGAAPHAIASDVWLNVGWDSLRVELVDLPDNPRTPVVYVPSKRWVYAWPAGAAQMDAVIAHIRRRGWEVERLASARGIAGMAVSGTAR